MIDRGHLFYIKLRVFTDYNWYDLIEEKLLLERMWRLC